MEPAIPSAPSQQCLAVVVFSKDRPCQLLASLASLLRHVVGVALDISVLFKVGLQPERPSESFWEFTGFWEFGV